MHTVHKSSIIQQTKGDVMTIQCFHCISDAVMLLITDSCRLHIGLDHVVNCDNDKLIVYWATTLV